MFLTLAIILAVIWLVLWLALHITSGLIHVLIALAVISFVVHLFRGRGGGRACAAVACSRRG